MAQPSQKQPVPPQVPVIVGTDAPSLRMLQSAASKAIINQYLLDANGQPKHEGITFERLLLDLAGAMSVNPDLAGCSEGSLFNCMCFAARHGMTFGDGGVWPIPQDKVDGKPTNARPQLSSRGMVTRTKEFGVERIEVVLIYKDDKVQVERDEAGQIAAFKHDYDIMAPRPIADCRGGFGVAFFTDGRKRISFYTIEDLQMRREYSAAQNSPMWVKSPHKGYERSIKSSVSKEIVVDFTRGAAQMGSLALPDGNSVDVEFEEVPEQIPFSSPTRDTADELAARVEEGELESRTKGGPTAGEEPWPEGVPKGMHHAAALTRGFAKAKASGESAETYWKAHGNELLKLAGADEKQFMLGLKDAQKPSAPDPQSGPETAPPQEENDAQKEEVTPEEVEEIMANTYGPVSADAVTELRARFSRLDEDPEALAKYDVDYASMAEIDGEPAVAAVKRVEQWYADRAIDNLAGKGGK